MELKIATSELAKALGRSQGIVEKKSTMPILSHVLLEARKDQLIVSATDLDLAVSSEHKEGCEVLKEGVARRLRPPPLRHRPRPARAAGDAQEGAQQLPRGDAAARPSSASSGSPPRTSRRCPRFEKVPFGDVDADSCSST